MTKIPLKMFRQGGLINILMVVGFADEVDNGLDHKTKEYDLEEEQEAEDSHPNPYSQTPCEAKHNKILKQQLNPREGDSEQHEAAHGDPRLPLDQIPALLQGLDPVNLFQDRNHRGQMPDYADVNESNKVSDQARDDEHDPDGAEP
ncbi:hypothetical protein TorRG33x02_221970 [Trema orientale]|uniref:Uncharacterized protein n=1 Tax=Trema orientale TaxID=63057 RepID=A0A2P5E8V7_TREOI|nr:hypothetical protein TorRG33x02_221970 [Trema orientale]